MSKQYIPKPIDVSDVVLPETWSDLIETLSANAHDIWATGRINDGWSYGATRDDLKKETPCLVDYFDLSEAEKNYDRRIVIDTLKTISKLGYSIVFKD